MRHYFRPLRRMPFTLLDRFVTCYRTALLFVGFTLKLSACPADTVESDICIYGGTSGGVVAAVQAARMSKKAVIIEPGRHLGGMTAGGLSWTDVGTSERVRAIGGIAREVYERIGLHY